MPGMPRTRAVFVASAGFNAYEQPPPDMIYCHKKTCWENSSFWLEVPRVNFDEGCQSDRELGEG
eukprot:scaffold1369_cov172-Pinguiococcus_pyrenoidosus.AAC.1